MTLQNTSAWKIYPFATDRFDSRYVTWMCALFAVLILGRALSNAMAYVFFAVAALVFVVSNVQHCAVLLFFLLPVASILKPSVGSMSFFTYFFFLTIAKMVVICRKLDLRLVLFALLFLAYNLISTGTWAITSVITMAAGALLLYYLRTSHINVRTCVLAFSAGICFASALALLRDFLPIINSFIQNATLKMGEGEYVQRFSGLSGNPNYYTMDIIMAQATLIVLMHREQKQLLYLLCFGALTVFGFMSISQSYLLAWALLIFCWFLLSLQKGISGALKFVFIGILMLAVLAVFAFEYLEAFAFRLLQGSQGNISSVTTGRTDIWLDYLDVIVSDMKVLFFGNGINTIVGNKAPHNSYLQTVFYFGITGSVIFLGMLKSSMQKIFTDKIMWVPASMLLVRMIAIGIVSYDNLWFYLGLLVLLANYCKTFLQDKEQSVQTS